MVLVLGCEQKSPGNGTPTPDASGSASGPSPASSPMETPGKSGLTPAEIRRFYHLPEGSEFLPMCALQILQKDGLFEKDLTKFGLLADPIRDELNPDGLPIGVVVDYPRDVVFKVKMVGFNCAACHVGRLSSNPPHEIIGAPSHFDIRRFFDKLIPPLRELMGSPTGIARIVVCAISGGMKDDLARRENAPPDELVAMNDVLLAAVESPETETAKKKPLGVALDRELSRTTEAAAPGKEAFGPDFAREIERADGSPESFNRLNKEKKQRVSKAVQRYLRDLIGLLTARYKSLERVAKVGGFDHTPPGPGRVDAFMTAINLMDSSVKLKMNSPVAFPHLWGKSNLEWLHWDDNTTARMQRNMGQAIGVGAVFTRDGASTLLPKNLDELEKLAQKIQPPAWPFGDINADLKSKGRGVYKDKCERCHSSVNGKLPDLKEDAGTDIMRLGNFDQEVNGQKVPDFLAQLLGKLEAHAHRNMTTPPEGGHWRHTGRYGLRTLEGVWATAPYLHNDSVPTLRDLLKRENERPKTFTLDYSSYDTKNVGMSVVPPSGAPQFDTTKEGNGNNGHIWGTELTEPEKDALIEYLKSL
jgi:hypothetical protein